MGTTAPGPAPSCSWPPAAAAASQEPAQHLARTPALLPLEPAPSQGLPLQGPGTQARGRSLLWSQAQVRWQPGHPPPVSLPRLLAPAPARHNSGQHTSLQKAPLLDSVRQGARTICAVCTSDNGRGAWKPSGRLSLIAAEMLLRVLEGTAAGAGACALVQTFTINDMVPTAAYDLKLHISKSAIGCATAFVGCIYSITYHQQP